MIKHLLACTDGSAYGEAACDTAIHLAQQLGGRVAGLHVLDIRLIEGPLLADVAGAIGAAEYAAGLPQFQKLMEEKGRAIAEGFCARARQQGMEATCAVETGHPAHVILEHQPETELLVMGQRGENEQFGRELVGSTVERVIRRALKPCLVTPAHFRPMARILAACDGSAVSSKALQSAAELAAALARPLTVLTVADDMPRAHAEKIAADALRLAASHDCQADLMVGAGDAGEAILRAAVDRQANLIVMGAHSHSRIRSLLLGCTTIQVLANTSVPVMLVR